MFVWSSPLQRTWLARADAQSVSFAKRGISRACWSTGEKTRANYSRYSSQVIYTALLSTETQQIQMCIDAWFCFHQFTDERRVKQMDTEFICCSLYSIETSDLDIHPQSSNPEVWRWICSQVCLLSFSSCVCGTPTTPTMTSGSPPCWTPPSTPSRTCWRWETQSGKVAIQTNWDDSEPS